MEIEMRLGEVQEQVTANGLSHAVGEWESEKKPLRKR